MVSRELCGWDLGSTGRPLHIRGKSSDHMTEEKKGSHALPSYLCFFALKHSDTSTCCCDLLNISRGHSGEFCLMPKSAVCAAIRCQHRQRQNE